MTTAASRSPLIVCALGHHIDIPSVHRSNASAALQATVKDNRSGWIT